MYIYILGRRSPGGERVLCKSTNVALRKTHQVKWSRVYHD